MIVECLSVKTAPLYVCVMSLVHIADEDELESKVEVSSKPPILAVFRKSSRLIVSFLLQAYMSEKLSVWQCRNIENDSKFKVSLADFQPGTLLLFITSCGAILIAGASMPFVNSSVVMTIVFLSRYLSKDGFPK